MSLLKFPSLRFPTVALIYLLHFSVCLFDILQACSPPFFWVLPLLFFSRRREMNALSAAGLFICGENRARCAQF